MAGWGREDWGIPHAIATVNNFRLPGNFQEPPAGDEDSDLRRWDSYRALFATNLARGKLDVNAMKSIVGFASTTGNAHTSGALFISNRDIITVQSMVLRMDTLELWVAFTPAGAGLLPMQPTYLRVVTPLESAPTR